MANREISPNTYNNNRHHNQVADELKWYEAHLKRKRNVALKGAAKDAGLFAAGVGSVALTIFGVRNGISSEALGMAIPASGILLSLGGGAVLSDLNDARVEQKNLRGIRRQRKKLREEIIGYDHDTKKPIHGNVLPPARTKS